MNYLRKRADSGTNSLECMLDLKCKKDSNVEFER